MPTVNDDDHAAEYWDEYIEDFGVSAYIEARYMEAASDMEAARHGKDVERYLDQAREDYRFTLDHLADEEYPILYSDTLACPRCGQVHPV